MRRQPERRFLNGNLSLDTASKVVSGGENGMDAIVAAGMRGGDAELLPSLRAGRPSAFAALMRQNNQRLFRLARGILRDEPWQSVSGLRCQLRRRTTFPSFFGCELETSLYCSGPIWRRGQTSKPDGLRSWPTRQWAEPSFSKSRTTEPTTATTMGSGPIS
jgi:hypothetical protein